MFSFRNVSISKQLGLFFALAFLIPTVAIGSFFYLSVQNFIEQSKSELNYFASLHVNRVQSVLSLTKVTGATLVSNKTANDELTALQINFQSLSKTGQMRFFTVGENQEINIISKPRSDAFTNSNIAHSNALVFAIRNILIQDRQNFSIVTDDRGHHIFLIARYFPAYHIGFFIQKDVAEVLSPLLGFRDIILASAGLILVLMILLLLFESQFITNPILEIAKVAKEIEQGDYRKKATVSGENEIGTLSRAFNKMSDELIGSNIALYEKVKEKTAKLQNALQIVHAQKLQDDALLSSIAEGMIAADKDGCVLLANCAAETMFGFSLRDVLGRPVLNVLSLRTDDDCPVSDVDHPAIVSLRTQQKCRRSYMCAITGGKTVSLEISAAPIILKGEVFGIILILTDITREKEIDKMKTEFISIASHQMRAPLASLKWYGDWFAKGKAGKLLKTQKEFIDKMNASTATMISLVDDFLNVSRIEQGKIKNEPADVFVSELVQNILDLSSQDTQEKHLHVSVENHFLQNSLRVDPDMIREIISNYISNAVKYTPENGYITVRFESDVAWFYFEVKNTGYGIPFSEQSRIFSKFYRASNMVKRGLKGTGLGLYTVKLLAESMGGSVGFESVENETTKFWVKLPAI